MESQGESSLAPPAFCPLQLVWGCCVIRECLGLRSRSTIWWIWQPIRLKNSRASRTSFIWSCRSRSAPTCVSGTSPPGWGVRRETTGGRTSWAEPRQSSRWGEHQSSQFWPPASILWFIQSKVIVTTTLHTTRKNLSPNSLYAYTKTQHWMWFWWFILEKLPDRIMTNVDWNFLNI